MSRKTKGVVGFVDMLDIIYSKPLHCRRHSSKFTRRAGATTGNILDERSMDLWRRIGESTGLQ